MNPDVADAIGAGRKARRTLGASVAAFRSLLALAFLLILMSSAAAQTFPSKSIRIVTGVTGGSLDLTARVLALKLAEGIGQQVIIDNRGGVISMEIVAKAPADGYTLLLAGGSLWTSQFLRDHVAWDALRDYTSVSLLTTSPNVVSVHPSMPVKSIGALIAFAKSRPGEINYSTGQAGASAHLAGELFKSMAGVNLVRIAYKGVGPAMLALITGEAHVSFPNAAAVMSFMKSGKVRGLAVTSTRPSLLAPGLPTVAASGLAGYESRAILGLFAPARTPSAVIEQLNFEIGRALHDAVVKQRLFESGAEVIAGPPAELTAAMKSEMATTGKLIRDMGIRAD